MPLQYCKNPASFFVNSLVINKATDRKSESGDDVSLEVKNFRIRKEDRSRYFLEFQVLKNFFEVNSSKTSVRAIVKKFIQVL